MWAAAFAFACVPRMKKRDEIERARACGVMDLQPDRETWTIDTERERQKEKEGERESHCGRKEREERERERERERE